MTGVKEHELAIVSLAPDIELKDALLMIEYLTDVWDCDCAVLKFGQQVNFRLFVAEEVNV